VVCTIITNAEPPYVLPIPGRPFLVNDHALSVTGITTAPDIELFEYPADYQSPDGKADRSFAARIAQVLNFL
jgi:hypothetical protein